MRKGWEIKSVGECFESIRNGATIKQERGATGIPITRIETLSGGVFNRDRLGYANIHSAEKYASYILDDGDMLLSHINSKTYIGRTVVYNKLDNEEIIHGMNLLRLKTIRTILSPYYAFYCFKSESFRNQIASYRKDAVNQSSIPVSDLKKITIPVPPLPEQEKIVSELDCLSSIIEKKRQQLNELDALAQAIFYEMFGNPVDNESGWEVKKLGEVASDIFAGGDKPKDISETQTEEYAYPVYANGDGDRGLLGYSKKYRVASKAVTIGARGASIGNCRICEGKFTPVVRLITIVPGEDLDIMFLYHSALKIDFDINGAGQAQLTIPNVVSKSIILPPLPLQQTFAQKIEAIEQQKALIKQSIAEVETLFNARMQEYFE